MKCAYGQNCKFGGEVEKDLAIKVNGKYYHKECYHEKKMKSEIENFYIENFPQTTLQILRRSIKQCLLNNEVDYLYYLVKYIKDNNKPINSPFALLNYCNDYRIRNSYNELKISNAYKNVKDKIKNNSDENIVSFTYKSINKNIKNII